MDLGFVMLELVGNFPRHVVWFHIEGILYRDCIYSGICLVCLF